MLAKKQAYLNLSIGIVLTVIGSLISADSAELFLLLGHIVVIYSCWLYAKAKGYKGILGVFLGLFSNVLGFIVLAILRDKQKTNQ